MKDLKQYYCEVTQEEANEARDLLVKAGEEIYQERNAFDVYEDRIYLQTYTHDDDWLVDYLYEKTESKTQITYPQFREMLIEKIKEK